jgi:CDP-glucose 4,6-dehydratase
LHKLGAVVAGYALPPPTTPALFHTAGIEPLLAAHHEGDLRDRERFCRFVSEFAPELIFHLGAQSLVRESYKSPAETFEVNVMGTVSVLESVRCQGRPCVVVIVTSDKCYENREHVWGYREIDPLGGHDPYSASKGTAEIVAAAYRRSFFPTAGLADHQIQVASVRAGNVIGGGDWATDRIIVDLVRHLERNEPVPVRNPRSIRPWQHVLEPLSGYLLLAARMITEPGAHWCDGWNFGPMSSDTVTVLEVVERFISAWGKGSWVDRSDPRQPHEAHLLRLSIEKALAELSWRPRWSVHDAIGHTARWYRRFYDSPNAARAACLDDINAYSGAL